MPPSTAAVLVRLDSQEAAPTRVEHENGNNEKSTSSSATRSFVRSLLLDTPLVLLFFALTTILLIQHVYFSLITPMIASYERDEMVEDFYDEFHNEFTYYNRYCGTHDLPSTRNANDLLVTDKMPPNQAADRMLQHGAVAFQNVLKNSTAAKLRSYLAAKHAIQDQLSYNEVFWSEQNRLALALGTQDDPIIAEALQQVGSHEVLKRTLESILGPDPAIVEISTLTLLHGGHDQDIHSDSDWFGSSLLYGRSFLHSYSLFVALQDTSKALGATTICPGSHYCADPDLEDICLENSFEVSTNGLTGDDGLLYAGDAFLFNQNVWHRGPANTCESQQDRIMFIMTFVGRAKQNPSDKRRQGLGTFYYQRWNMWGHTYADLKHAGKGFSLKQPWAALRALGLFKFPSQNWGIWWWEQFSQQVANGADFYDDYELYSFKTKVLDKLLPPFLQSRSETWLEFIPETMHLIVVFLVQVNVVFFVVYLMVMALSGRAQAREDKNRRSSLIKRLLGLYGGVCFIMLAALIWIYQTEWARYVTSGQVHVRPFPAVTSSSSDTRPTTLPERNDVLVGTRFDAEFLASYNRFLHFHPGNKRWLEMVDAASRMPLDMSSTIVHSITQTRDERGLLGRFLLQDYVTGAWRIMTPPQAVQETRQQIKMNQNAVLEKLVTHLKQVLAEARFGVARDTAMTQRFGPLFVEKWMPLLFDTRATSTTCQRLAPQMVKDTQNRTSMKAVSQLPKMSPTSRDWRRLPAMDNSAPKFQAGHRVWVQDASDEKWYDADITRVLGDDMYAVVYPMDGHGTAHADYIRPHEPFKQGDCVEVDFGEAQGGIFAGTITNVHPNGKYSVAFDDGDYQSRVPHHYMLALFE